MNEDSGTDLGSFKRTVMAGKTRNDKIFHLVEKENRPASRPQKPLKSPVAPEPLASTGLVIGAVRLSHAVERDANASGDRLAKLGLARPRAAVEKDVNALRRLGRGLPQNMLDLIPIGRNVIEVLPPAIRAKGLPEKVFRGVCPRD